MKVVSASYAIGVQNGRGAIEVRVANQHVRKSKSHQEKRHKESGDTAEFGQSMDIRRYLQHNVSPTVICISDDSVNSTSDYDSTCTSDYD